jgi:hypothetical protein
MKYILRGIDSILNKLGYYKAEVPDGGNVSKSDVYELFASYGENELFMRFLRDLAERDVKLYFQANNDRDRDALRGAHARTNYFIALIRKINDKRTRSQRKPGGQ